MSSHKPRDASQTRQNDLQVFKQLAEGASKCINVPNKSIS